MSASLSRRRSLQGQRGISLIIAMLMLAIIGLTSAAVMRNATSADQVATNNRLQTQAHQFAQLALRFCESQVALSEGARTVTVAAAASNAWTSKANWLGGGGGQHAHALGAGDSSGAVHPRVAPQCMAESTTTPEVFTVTARGFSPDFTADPTTGAARSGSVVWLQSTVLVGVGDGAGGGAAVRQRLWQQLLTPPF